MFERICAATGDNVSGHIRLLSRLHCAMRRARSVYRIMRFTTFRRSRRLNKRGSSSLRCSFLIVRRGTGTPYWETGQRLLKSAAKICTATHAHAAHAHGHHHGHHDRLLLHHCASPILFDPLCRGVAMRITQHPAHCQPFLTSSIVFPLFLHLTHL